MMKQKYVRYADKHKLIQNKFNLNAEKNSIMSYEAYKYLDGGSRYDSINRDIFHFRVLNFEELSQDEDEYLVGAIYEDWERSISITERLYEKLLILDNKEIYKINDSSLREEILFLKTNSQLIKNFIFELKEMREFAIQYLEHK